MNRRTKIIVSVSGIFIVLLALIGLTYAYFVTRIKGNTNDKSVSINTAKLELVYGDGNGIIKPTELLEPGTPIDSKTFSVESKSDETIDTYGVYLENLTNDFSLKEDVTITLTCKEYDVGTNNLIKDCTGLTNYVFPTKNELIVENRIDPNVRQDYTLTVNYEENNKDQSIDMNKRIKAKIQIYDTNNVIELKGRVNGSQAGDYIELIGATETKISHINNDEYNFVGVLPGEYILSVKNITDGVETLKGKTKITIERAASESINNNTIKITESTKQITMDINNIVEDLDTNISIN